MSAYCDVDWAACPSFRKLISGYLIKFGNSLITWKSKKQTTVSRSSAQAEYKSLASIVTEVIWLTRFLKEIVIEFELPIEIFSDSKTAMQIAANPVYHEKNKTY